MSFKINNTTVIDDNSALEVTALQLNTQNSVFTIGDTDFQGRISGFTSGAFRSDVPGLPGVIDKFSFATDSNAVSFGVTNFDDNNLSGQSSSTHGYITAGAGRGGYIEKFSFYIENNSSFNVGFLTTQYSPIGPGGYPASVYRTQSTGQSSSTHGFTSGGVSPNPFQPDVVYVDIIDKFPFAADGNALDVGDLTLVRSDVAGQSSTTHGYTSGGYYLTPAMPSPTGGRNIIDKFPFTTNANATNVGVLSQARYGSAGQSSTISGYTSGGFETINNLKVNIIDKFPFAADGNAIDVGDLTVTRMYIAGQSSRSHGYNSGGFSTLNLSLNTIDKFPFVTDSNAADVGDLTVIRQNGAGHQF